MRGLLVVMDIMDVTNLYEGSYNFQISTFMENGLASMGGRKKIFIQYKSIRFVIYTNLIV